MEADQCCTKGKEPIEAESPATNQPTACLHDNHVSGGFENSLLLVCIKIGLKL